MYLIEEHLWVNLQVIDLEDCALCDNILFHNAVICEKYLISMDFYQLFLIFICLLLRIYNFHNNIILEL